MISAKVGGNAPLFSFTALFNPAATFNATLREDFTPQEEATIEAGVKKLKTELKEIFSFMRVAKIECAASEEGMMSSLASLADRLKRTGLEDDDLQRIDYDAGEVSRNIGLLMSGALLSYPRTKKLTAKDPHIIAYNRLVDVDRQMDSLMKIIHKYTHYGVW
jgi:hypothetical protein